jgi:hypothetical protein
MQHPSYSEFILHDTGDWAWARKRPSDRKTIAVRRQETYRDVIVSMKYRLKKILSMS